MAVLAKEFVGERAQLYKEVLNEFPLVREEEVKLNLGYLKPERGEKILEIGAGSGLYSRPIAELLGSTGELVATDPSADQLENIRTFKRANMRMIEVGADFLLADPSLMKETESFDAIWSLGAFHHCMNKSQAFKNFHSLLKGRGRMLLCDVFSGSKLATYFDAEVARYSVTGHEVAFLTHEFARSLCYLFGFSDPKFHDLDYHWNFTSREELGLFMYKLHGMSHITPDKCLKKVEEFMDVERKDDLYILHVPLTILETYKK